MSRVIIAILAVAGFLALATAAPVPTHLMQKPRPIYFPTEVGTRWVTEHDGTETGYEIVEVQKVEGGTKVIVGYGRGDSRASRKSHLVSEDGVALLGDLPARLGEPFWIFRSGPIGDSRWKWNCKFDIPNVVEAEGTFEVIGTETITVPAGTFKTVRVEMKITLPKGDETTTWFAPGIGKVREDWKGKRLEVLKSFEPAGRKPKAPVEVKR